jgi:hypothetical protein
MPMIEFSADDFWTPECRAAVQDRIEAVLQYLRPLKRREREFLESIAKQFADGGILTPEQEAWLDSLYDKLG